LLVKYVEAVKGQGSTLKECLPFLCPDVDYLERMLGCSDAVVIMAKDGDAIVGVVGGWLEGTPSGYDVEDMALRQHEAYHEAHLDWIALKEEYREKGIGSALVERICNWARERSKEKIWTEALRKTSIFEETVTFYNKLGFKEIGTFRDQKGEEYVTMLRQL